MEAEHFETLDSAVRKHLTDALMLAGGNQRHAAALLGVTRWRLGRLITRFELRDLVKRMRTVDRQRTAISVTEQAARHVDVRYAR